MINIIGTNKWLFLSTVWWSPTAAIWARVRSADTQWLNGGANELLVIDQWTEDDIVRHYNSTKGRYWK